MSKFVIVLAAIVLFSLNADAYTDSRGYRPSGECDILAAIPHCYDDLPEAPQYITKYGKRMKVPARGAENGVTENSYNAWAYCQRIVGESNSLMETCLKSEREAGERIGR